MKKLLTILSALALSGVSLQASTVVLDFETAAASGVDVNSTLPSGVTIKPVVYTEQLDGFGDGTGVFAWATDSGIIQAVNSSVYGSALTVTGNYAADLVFGPAWIQFASPLSLDTFSLTSGGLGGGIPVDAIFLDSLGAELGRLSFDQSFVGLSTKNLGGALVSSVVLPSGTLYDNISYSTLAVPEPSRALLLMLGVAGAGMQRRRRK